MIYLQKFLPYWPLFVVSIALCLAIAYVKLRAEQPMYIADGKIMLKDPVGRGSESKVLDEFSIEGEKKQVENEILVLRSAVLMQEVVKRLHLGATVYNQGRVRLEELYQDNSPISFIPVYRDSIQDGGTYYFKVDWNKGEVEIDNRRVAFNGTLRIANTDYKVVPTADYNKTVQGKNYFVEFSSVEGMAGNLIGSLSANPTSLTSSVIDINLTTAVPQKGKDVLQTLFDVYNEFAILDKRRSAKQTLEFIEGRLADVALDLDTAEGKAVDFQSKTASFDLQAQAADYWKQASDFEAQKSKVDLQLQQLNGIRSYVQSGGSVPSLGTVADPTLATAIGAYQVAQADLQKIELAEGPLNPNVIAEKQKVESLRKNLLDNISNVQSTLASTRSNFSNLMGRSEGRLRSNPQQAKAFAALKRQTDVKSTIFNFLLEKREETQLNSAGDIADMKVLESPSAYGPVSPVPKSFYTQWFMIGLVIPAAFVFLKDLFNRRIQLRAEIEQKTDVPIIGEISQIETESPVVIREGKRTAVAEQFRALRTNLTFLGLGEKDNTVMITSSSSGEGKSFLAINLAISFTLIGKKVALMELDLRKPKISKLMDVRNDVGISNYLVNQASIAEIIRPTEIKDLFVVPSGIIPPNPAELIQRERFQELMTEIKERFDFVIIDTAPVGPVADSFLLKDYTDATVYVVRQNKTLRSHLKMIDDINRKKRFKNLCLVFNGLRKRGLVYGAYGYGSYGYGDGYYVNEQPQGRISVIGHRLRKMVGLKN